MDNYYPCICTFLRGYCNANWRLRWRDVDNIGVSFNHERLRWRVCWRHWRWSIGWHDWKSFANRDCFFVLRHIIALKIAHIVIVGSVWLIAYGIPGLWLAFADVNTLVPRVLKACLASTSTLTEPRTSAGATTLFVGFTDGTASGTYGNGGRRCRICRYLIIIG